jgi:hypothetical protein
VSRPNQSLQPTRLLGRFHQAELVGRVADQLAFGSIMARIWKEKRTGHWSRHFDLHGYRDLPGHDISPDEKLVPVFTYYVRVCSFTFRFGSVAQIRPVLEFYSREIHPSSRMPDSQWLRAEHDVAQRWFERLPPYLMEDAKRPRVVKALEEALVIFKDDLCRYPTQLSRPGNLPRYGVHK